MSVVIQTFVYCDGCSENKFGDDWDNTAAEIRAARKLNDGWIQRGSNDFCPDCARKLKLLKVK